MRQVLVSGPLDDLRSIHLRFLQEAAKLGELTVLMWSDEAIRQAIGKPPKFPESERQYLLQSIRYVQRVEVISQAITPGSSLAGLPFRPDLWAVLADASPSAWPTHDAGCGIELHEFHQQDLLGFPELEPVGMTGKAESGGSHDQKGTKINIDYEDEQKRVAYRAHPKKVLVTGCYDWFHSGHVRFFEEAAELGDLYVVLGHDANVRALKGEGHPLFPQAERRYLVQSIRFVKQALISTGQGWLDAEPEIQRLKPDLYVVNEDGDRPVKREFCEKHQIEYCVLKRLPKAGLPRRQSTDLRGF